MFHFVTKLLLLLLAASVLISPIAGADIHGTTVSYYVPHPSPADVESEIIITATDAVMNSGGYTVNDVPKSNSERIELDGYGGEFIIKPVSVPDNTLFEITLTYFGRVDTLYPDKPLTLTIPQHLTPMSIVVHLDLYSETSTDDDNEGGGSNPGTSGDGNGGTTGGDGGTDTGGDNTGNEGGGDDDSSVKPSNPSTSDVPSVPDTPSEPENPPTDEPGTDEPTKPDTPGSDEPGSDEPYLPILPPAGSVYNLAGFIPLAAGFLLLFLVFFWRRKVYRILKSHAKKHGEKPEKEHLKEIADAIIKLVRDEGRYPEWKKNSDVAKRLSADIVSVLDEMNYPKLVPRGALVAEIIKAARGKINRHRL